jgi:hypothetical protein
MNIKSVITICAALVLVSAALPAAEPRAGVYDSRAVAYAYFWSPPFRQERDALLARAKAAKEAGDTALLNELKPRIVAEQKQAMLAVFSTAPADDAMAAIKDMLPAIEQDLGVNRLISKWDEDALKGIPEANRVDATDRLVRAFFPKPSEHLRSQIKAFEAAKPLPLWQARLLCLFGGM